MKVIMIAVYVFSAMGFWDFMAGFFWRLGVTTPNNLFGLLIIVTLLAAYLVYAVRRGHRVAGKQLS